MLVVAVVTVVAVPLAAAVGGELTVPDVPAVRTADGTLAGPDGAFEEVVVVVVVVVVDGIAGAAAACGRDRCCRTRAAASAGVLA